jgi:hypothetical protein
MEVVAFTLSAIGFVDSAIKSGTSLARIFKDCGDAGKHISNATQRLEAQKYTLELWQKVWERKAKQQQRPTVEDSLRNLWGENGYEMIRKCLAQVNVKFGEAFRTLQSIDPDSFAYTKSLTTPDNVESPASSSFRLKLTGKLSRSRSRSNISSTDPLPSLEPEKDRKDRKKSRFSMLSPSNSPGFLRHKSSSSISSLADDPDKLAQKALQQKMSPGTKFKWSVSLKEQLRSLINDIDDWLALLENLAAQCEAERSTDQGQSANSPSSIRAAAKALYTALSNIPSGHDLDFKLEKERADSEYFEQVVGPLEYLDHSNRSFKFPLLISSTKEGDEPFLLLAEAIYPSAMVTPVSPLDKETSLAEIVKCLRDPKHSHLNSATSLLFRSQQTTIVIHGIKGATASSPTVQAAFLRCSFAELLRAEAGVDPLVAHSKRLQLACIIAISVLHLYETGWISEHLETNDFHFFGSADSQYHELTRISPYVSAVSLPSKATGTTTPFDCLKRTHLPASLLGSRDERLATLFHRLGIVLFELGRGIQHREIFEVEEPSESQVLAEIEKIQFGRPYRDLVKVCLTGSLYATSVINIDTRFDRAVVEK